MRLILAAALSLALASPALAQASDAERTMMATVEAEYRLSPGRRWLFHGAGLPVPK